MDLGRKIRYVHKASGYSGTLWEESGRLGGLLCALLLTTQIDVQLVNFDDDRIHVLFLLVVRTDFEVIGTKFSLLVFSDGPILILYV